MRTLLFCLLVIFLVFILSDLCEGKGGRGGRGGGRGRSRSGSRVRSRNRGSRVRSFRSSRFVNWKTAAAAGALIGFSRYKRRGLYHADREPTICRNDDYLNSTLIDEAYAYFICPMEADPDSYTRCCGPNNREQCCKAEQGTNLAAAIAVPVIIAIAVIALCVFCCLLKKGKFEGSSESPEAISYNANSQAAGKSYGEPSINNGVPPKSMGYPVAPPTYSPGNTNGNMPEPPPYSQSGNEYYPPQPQPGSDGSYMTTPYPPSEAPQYPPGSTAPYPTGSNNAPYPTTYDNAAYPTGSNDAPYPTGGPAPYPAAPYPTDSANPVS